MLITEWAFIFPRSSYISSTSASKFEFFELPYARVVNNSNLKSRVTRIYSTALTFLVDAHSNLSAREFKFELFTTRAYGGSRNSNFKADVLEI